MYCTDCWAQAWKVTQRKMGDTVVCVLHALVVVLEEATMLRSAQEFQWTAQLGRVSEMSKALLDAWLACVDIAWEAFPHVVERAAPTCPANWIELTREEGPSNRAEDMVRIFKNWCVSPTRAPRSLPRDNQSCLLYTSDAADE